MSGGKAYATVGGKLKLKGADIGGSKVPTGVKRPRSDISGGSSLDPSKPATLPEKPAEITQPASRTLGTGKIMTSGLVVQGFDTSFMSEVKVGDAIEVYNPAINASDVRVVTMVVANTSACINAPFAVDVTTQSPFHILKLPKAILTPEMMVAEAERKRKEEEKSAYGAFASEGGKVYTYREKKSGTFGGYKIVSVKLDDKKSREELLDMRAKVKSDKFC